MVQSVPSNVGSANLTDSPQVPLLSVIVLNYNGERWLRRCLGSLHDQTIFKHIEIIVADNASPDQSYNLAVLLTTGWSNAKVIQFAANLGYCEGNNRAAAEARGDYLLFLNNDTWLEPQCLEQLHRTVTRLRVGAAAPLIMNYADDSIQSSGADGFDAFGLMSLSPPRSRPQEIFVVGGCSYFVERALFNRLGGFDSVFHMYADEYDLSWRVWIAGASAILVPDARLHHRGAASVNPAGGGLPHELRTSDTKRFYSNRNGLLVLLKNCQHLLLLLIPLQLGLLTLEACVFLLIVRRWSFLKRAYLDAVVDCWKLRRHVLAERRRINSFRKRGDFAMLRFLCLRPNRWDELVNVLRLGIPKVDQR
jgi:GT2 family glycosyltransferase